MKNANLAEDVNLDNVDVSRETSAECEETLETEETSETNSAYKPKVVRTRSFALQCYDKRDDLISFLNNAPWIQHWALCTHDKDVWTKADEKKDPSHKAGTLKEVHTHVLIYTYEAKTKTAIRKNFARFSKEINPDNPQNTLAQTMSDTVMMWRYLRHLDNPEKYQYTEEERICDNKSYWKKYEKTDGMNDPSSNSAYTIFNDMLGGVPVKEMILRYGKEYVYHYKHFQEIIGHYRYETTTPTNESNVDEFVGALSHVLGLSSKFNSHQRELFACMLKEASMLLDLWDGITYKVIKIDKNGEII